ncbi:zinc finger and BTB domain-containing protein 42-like [Megalops cyprinoides]|uniref:zinc finger and BTB domain-containing protein 42-like n=1 Tax=Megalops cyprinoides TaxID=118141 RepID=UPI001865147C|nr:zinc finger and BTB domain-containing protein 42-like [Megalops cyprinoides]
MEFPDHSRQLLQRLRQQRHQGFLCDCTVVVGEARFKAHRAVLASCSVFFHLFYRDRLEERDVVCLDSDIVTATAFGLLLEFMYEGKLELGGLPVKDVLAAAGYLHMYEIVRVCEGKMSDKERVTLEGGVSGGTALGCMEVERCDSELHGKQLSPSAQQQSRTTPVDELDTDNQQIGPAVGDCERSGSNRQKANGHLCGSRDLSVEPELVEVSETFVQSTRETKADLVGPVSPPHRWSQALDDTNGALDLSLKRLSGRDRLPPSRPSRQLAFYRQQRVANLVVKDEQGLLSELGDGEPTGQESRRFGTGARTQAALLLGNKSPASTLHPQEEEQMEGEGEMEEGNAGQLEGSKDPEEEVDEDIVSINTSTPGGVNPPRGRRPRQPRLCPCPLCGGVFPSPHTLQLHLSTHFLVREGPSGRLPRGGGPAPTCPQCGKSFSCLYTLKRHERTHSGEKPYACGQCGKGFQYSHNLTRHALVHTREKPHACRWCERRFTQSGDLYRHVRKFHCDLAETLAVD